MMLSQSEMIRIIGLIEKLAEKRNAGGGSHPYASFEYNGSYPQLHISLWPAMWYDFTDSEYVGRIGGKYKPLAEGIKMLEELTS